MARLSTHLSHHVWYDSQPGHRLALALCGVIVPRAESDTDPTCPVCKGLLAERDRDIETAMRRPEPR